MSHRARAASLLRNLFRRRAVERDLDEEVRAYADLLADEKAEAGMEPDEARRAAHAEMGGVDLVKEQVRDARAGAWIEQRAQDVRFGLRLLRRSPGFAAVAVLTLALGIGANTAIFSVVDRVLLRPAPFPGLDRLVMLWETDRASGTTREPGSVPDFLDYREQGRTIERLGALMAGDVNLLPAGGEPARLAALRVTHDLFPLLGVEPLAGRTFSEAEDRDKGPRVVLISESLWERVFQRDPAVTGRSLRLDDDLYQVVGVMPDDADFGVLQVLSAAAYARGFADRGDRQRVDVWAPLQPDPEEYPRSTHPIFMIGRLREGATAAASQRELEAIASRLERAYPENAARGAFVEPLDAVVFGPVRPALLVLLGAVGLVLLVACINVANLLLARGGARAREVAVRTALGAGGRRLAIQFVVENLLLAVVAGALGVLLAFAGLRALVALAPADIPRLAGATLDARILAATLGVSLAVGLLFGCIPALQARRVDLQQVLQREGGLGASAGRQRGRLRSILVVAELAAAVVLLVGAGLLMKSFWMLQQVDPGFRADGVLKAEYQLPSTRYPADFSRWPDFKEQHAFTRALLARAAALPGVESAAVAGNHPLDPGFTNSFTVVGREAEARNWPEISVRRVTAGYFGTVGLQRVRGRLLEEADTTTAPAVLVVNEAAARRFFQGRDPLGAQIRIWGTARTIVGVVANERFQGLTAAPPLAVYLPLWQAPSANGVGVLLARTSRDPLSIASGVGAAFRSLDPSLAVFGVEPLEHTVGHSVARRRFTLVLLGVFAAVALLLAVVGIYGVLSLGVAQRTREIGMRMALGADAAAVVRLVVGQAMALVLGGLALGLAGAALLTRLMTSLLFGVTPRDAATFAAVPLVLVIVAAAAAAFPARRATKIDPTLALRTE